MKKLWTLIKTHFAEDFTWPYYLSILTFLAIAIAINFVFDLETRIDRYQETSLRVLFYFILYATAYYAGFVLMVVFRKKYALLKGVQFWILSLLGLVILSLDGSYPYMKEMLAQADIDIHIYPWVYAISANSISFLWVTIPLFFVYRALPVSRINGFGILTPSYDVRPYFQLLLVILPVIGAASFLKEFTAFYPTYKSNSVADVLHLPKWMPMMIYEFFYGLDFFNVELLFRGFLVIGLSQVLGKNAIMPMVTTYCFLHFGKPVGEQISSIAGGYALGIIAFYTRGIWGGVIVHIGVAWSMELTAYLQKIKI